MNKFLEAVENVCFWMVVIKKEYTDWDYDHFCFVEPHQICSSPSSVIEVIEELNKEGFDNREIGVASFYFDTNLGMDFVDSADDFIEKLNITQRCWEKEIKETLKE